MDWRLDIETKEKYRFRLRSDGYRLYATQLSDLPINGDNEEHCVFEWKHSYALCADSIVDRILDLTSRGALLEWSIAEKQKIELRST